MLSQSNIDKLNMNGLYSLPPDEKYRGSLHRSDLYHCCNWTFKPRIDREGNYRMVDSYWSFMQDSLQIMLTDENFDQFSFIFDLDEVIQLKESQTSKYDKVYHVATDSGGLRYAKYYIDKNAKKSKSLILKELERKIDECERELNYMKETRIKVINDEINLDWVH